MANVRTGLTSAPSGPGRVGHDGEARARRVARRLAQRTGRHGRHRAKTCVEQAHATTTHRVRGHELPTNTEGNTRGAGASLPRKDRTTGHGNFVLARL